VLISGYFLTTRGLVLALLGLTILAIKGQPFSIDNLVITPVILTKEQVSLPRAVALLQGLPDLVLSFTLKNKDFSGGVVLA
jgi:hypothetical protein